QSFAQSGGCFRVHRQALVRLQGFENELGKIAWLKLSLGKHDNHILGWPYVYSLSTATYGFKHTRMVCAFHPPGISIVVFVYGLLHLRAGGVCDPRFRKDLTLFPSTALKKELPQLGHIARAELQVIPAMGMAAGIRRPVKVGNSKRAKEFLAREFECVCAGTLGKDRGEHMRVTAAIGESRTRFRDHRQIQHEL